MEMYSICGEFSGRFGQGKRRAFSLTSDNPPTAARSRGLRVSALPFSPALSLLPSVVGTQDTGAPAAHAQDDVLTSGIDRQLRSMGFDTTDL